MSATALTVSSTYRGWMSHDEAGRVVMLGEGDIMQRLTRDWSRFGPNARIRFFASTIEFEASQLDGTPWQGEGYIAVDRALRSADFDLAASLRPLIGKFVLLEIEWRKE